MKAMVLVALGGAAGSVIRYLCQRVFNQTFPVGTLAVNLAGCFLIGVLWAVFVQRNQNREMQLLLITGFCGGFTTFSAFTQETLQLAMNDKWGLSLLYLFASVAGGLLATFAGYKLFS
jgi:fluoride exporter